MSIWGTGREVRDGRDRRDSRESCDSWFGLCGWPDRNQLEDQTDQRNQIGERDET